MAVTQTPGRVNLIGEHTDYNGGLVLPAAIPLGIDVALGPSPDTHDVIASQRFDATVTLPLAAPPGRVWSDYASGALQAARKAGLLQSGARLVIDSEIPHGAGLSSSAALIVGVLRAAAQSAGHDLPITDLARLAQQVETDFIGMPCGIMDQMAVAAAPPGFAIALDTRHLSFEAISLPETHHVAVVHSGITRRLDEGRYAERRAECEQARDRLGAEDLCHLTPEQIAQIDNLPPALAGRARHALTEQARVIAAVEALRTGALDRLGMILRQGHASLRDDFAVSLPAIDALVEAAIEAGALGARLTGGGFGGCIVALVARDDLDAWQARLLSNGTHGAARFIC